MHSLLFAYRDFSILRALRASLDLQEGVDCSVVGCCVISQGVTVVGFCISLCCRCRGGDHCIKTCSWQEELEANAASTCGGGVILTSNACGPL